MDRNCNAKTRGSSPKLLDTIEMSKMVRASWNLNLLGEWVERVGGHCAQPGLRVSVRSSEIHCRPAIKLSKRTLFTNSSSSIQLSKSKPLTPCRSSLTCLPPLLPLLNFRLLPQAQRFCVSFMAIPCGFQLYQVECHCHC